MNVFHKILITTALSITLIPLQSFGQSIVEAEYFIDSDPGVGNGVALEVDSSDDIEDNFEFNTDTLSVGRHVLYIRVLDDQEVWSLYSSAMFYVNETIGNIGLSHVEYFIDNDPGVGGGELTDADGIANVDFEAEVLTDTLSRGLHFLYARVSDENGIWSLYLRKTIHVFEPIDPLPIVAIEYAYDSIPEPGAGIVIDIDPAASVDNIFEASTTELNGEGAHALHVRLLSESGSWSLVATDSFDVSGCGAVTALDFFSIGNVNESIIINTSDDNPEISEGSIVSIISSPSKGVFSVNDQGNIEYIANEGTIGEDSLRYRICNDCGACDSAWVKITIPNLEPEMADSTFVLKTGTTNLISFKGLISDPNNNIDEGSFEIITMPEGILNVAIVDGFQVSIDLSDLDIVGVRQMTLRICDDIGECKEKTFDLEIEGGELLIYNAVSPNGDGNNDFMEIKSIAQFPDNQLIIFNRLGDKVFEIINYDNLDKRFEGYSNVGRNDILPSGTYYYELKIKQPTSSIYRGFIVIKK